MSEHHRDNKPLPSEIDAMSIDELIEKIDEKKQKTIADYEDIGIDKLKDFAHFVARWMFIVQWEDDNGNTYNELNDAFCEIACRKLRDIGIVRIDEEGYWSYKNKRQWQ